MTTKHKTDNEKLLTIRTLQRDMMLWASSACLSARKGGSTEAIQAALDNLQKAVDMVEAELL